ncbi:MAG: hypothetical protein HY662_04130 [Chloroflexi bacterium]|nr:hypothetical protein [Chloroflexota bacterium]
MTEKKRGGEHYAPVWGIFLLFLGIVFLLQSLGLLPWTLWGTLWRFWPVLLISAGLGILLRRFNVWLVSILILVLLAASLGIAIWQHGATSLSGQSTVSYSKPLDTLKQAEIEIDFAAGSLTLDSLSAGSTNLVEVGTGDGRTSIITDFRLDGNTGKLHLSKEQLNRPFWDRGNDNWRVAFTRNIPLTFNIKSAASSEKLDFSQLRAKEIRLDVDAGNTEIIMPSSSGTINAYLKTNVANTEVTIPIGVAARILVNSNLSATDINQNRFPKQGAYYASSNFDTATNRIYLEIDSNVGKVQVK